MAAFRINPRTVQPSSSSVFPTMIRKAFSQLRIDPTRSTIPVARRLPATFPRDPTETPFLLAHRPTIVLEVLCDPGTWEDPNLLGAHPPTCIASQASPGFLEGVAHLNADEVPVEEPPALFLTEDERRLLSQEGVLLHDAVHLSQAEEQILKKIRRKIRNKQSAQDSRRRKKEYLDGLETQVAACSAQNQDLKRKVQQLEKHKESLLDQLQKLQGLLTQPPSKAVQTSTCLGILLVSFGLFLWPTCASFYGASQVGGENPEPSGVLSRNFLTQKGPSEPGTPSAARHPKEPHAQEESPRELRTSRVGEHKKSHPVAGETTWEPGSEPQTQLKDLRRGKATRPDLDEI
uniref:Cyclic AMP-responsive element-binding protein 3-like protein 4 n=1 Tax=Laticauda laticaudata TaxID=8630 RepID=A0A8C5REW5_LATLA